MSGHHERLHILLLSLRCPANRRCGEAVLFMPVRTASVIEHSCSIQKWSRTPVHANPHHMADLLQLPELRQCRQGPVRNLTWPPRPLRTSLEAQRAARRGARSTTGAGRHSRAAAGRCRGVQEAGHPTRWLLSQFQPRDPEGASRAPWGRRDMRSPGSSRSSPGRPAGPPRCYRRRPGP